MPGYPALEPLAGIATIALMVLGIYFLLSKFAPGPLDRLLRGLKLRK